MIVPASRAQAHGWRLVTWALFGNDEGGLYGERDDWSYLPGNGARTLWTAIRWWCRNPLHNLFWHVLDWPRATAIVLYDRIGHEGTWFYERETLQWLPGDHCQVTLAPLFVGFKRGRWEGYIGFRDKEGVLGLKLKRSST